MVMGAGVVGVTTAWYLAQAGHEVSVLDRRNGPGLETSFANGGQVSASHAEPWANVGTPSRIWRWLGQDDAPLVFDWRRRDPELWRWGLKFLRNCTAARARVNIGRTLRVALYSRQCLKALRAATGVTYDQRSEGILHVYRDPHSFQAACREARVMESFGLARHVTSVAECIALEPALSSVADQLQGGIFTQDDESGDAYLFTRHLAELCAARGVSFHYDTEIEGFERRGKAIVGIKTKTGMMTADAYVLAAGAFSRPLAKSAGLDLPIYPAKGYSATIPVLSLPGAPTLSITDDERKMVYSRLGDKLRAAGTAELIGWDVTPNPVRERNVLKNAQSLFPHGGDFDNAVLWAGLRPVTPDSVPLLGRTKIEGLFLNTGHGTLGWTMACGSAKAVSDVISGTEPEIDMTGLGLERI